MNMTLLLQEYWMYLKHTSGWLKRPVLFMIFIVLVALYTIAAIVLAPLSIVFALIMLIVEYFRGDFR